MVNNKKSTKKNTKSSPKLSKQSSRRNKSRKNKSRTTSASTNGEPNNKNNSDNANKSIENSNIEEDSDVCCMCMEPIKSKYFQPSKCLQKYASRAHKICGECWWGEFAKEGMVHECPGCAKNLPLPKKGKKITKDSNTIEIDLTEE